MKNWFDPAVVLIAALRRWPSTVRHARSRIDGLRRDDRGTVTIMTAAMSGVVLLLMVGTSQIMTTISKKQELENLVQTACARAIRPTRMRIYKDEDRQAHAVKAFDQLAADRGIAVTARTITAGFLETSITASSTVPPIVSSFGIGETSISATDTCKGVPPYPALGDVILSSAFTKPGGSALTMKYGNWDVYKAVDVGWDGGDGYGVEIQDWSKGFGGWGGLPKGTTNPYMVELDSDNFKPDPNHRGNSSMYKNVELHKGTYRFSFWYYGRQADVNTNRISVYLEGVLPVSASVQKLTVAEPVSKGWIFKEFNIEVDTYSIYKLTIKAEGTDDSYGGNFNDLKLTYIKRPASAYND